MPGLIFFVIIVVCGASVSNKADDVVYETILKARAKGMNALKRAGVAAVMGFRLTGYTVMGIHVNQEFAVTLAWAIFIEIFACFAAGFVAFTGHYEVTGFNIIPGSLY